MSARRDFMINDLVLKVPGLKRSVSRRIVEAILQCEGRPAASCWISVEIVKVMLDNGADAVRMGSCPSLVVYFVGAARNRFDETGHAELWPRKLWGKQ
jgi:hypothetical protein